MTHPCKGCVDACEVQSNRREYTCDFLLHNGHARSLICPPGALCTVKSTVPRSTIPATEQPAIGKGGRRICWDQVEARRLWKLGLSDAEISRRIGTSKQNIQAWRTRRGMKANGRGKANA